MTAAVTESFANDYEFRAFRGVLAHKRVIVGAG